MDKSAPHGIFFKSWGIIVKIRLSKLYAGKSHQTP